MSPDDICQALKRWYSNLDAEQRKDGWSFYLSPSIRSGPRSNRIIRASRASPNAGTRLKLAVSSRLGDEVEIDFTGNESALRRYVEKEIQLFEKHFEK